MGCIIKWWSCPVDWWCWLGRSRQHFKRCSVLLQWMTWSFINGSNAIRFYLQTNVLDLFWSRHMYCMYCGIWIVGRRVCRMIVSLCHMFRLYVMYIMCYWLSSRYILREWVRVWLFRANFRQYMPNLRCLLWLMLWFGRQLVYWVKSRMLFVTCTSLFYLFDYMPYRLLHFWSTMRSLYLGLY